MAETSSFLRKRVAGIPVLYLMGGAAVILAVVAWRMQAAKSEDGTSEDEVTSDVPMESNQNGDAASEANAYDGFVAKESLVAAPADKATDQVPEETNGTWLKKAVEWRVSQGASAGTVQQALQAYLQGAQLSVNQGVERDRAVKQFGLPPDPPETTSTAAAPAAAPAPAKVQGPLPRSHKIVNSNDDTFADLARLYYPTGDANSVLLIAAANETRLTGTGPFKPGTTVVVPRYIVPVYYTATKSIDTASEIARKNGVSAGDVRVLNPGMKFPVKSGTRVRVK